jgi:Arc/MetJ family transcription regulator
MRISLDLPDGLMEEVMKASHRKTKRAAVAAALREFVRRNRLQDIRRFKGRIDLGIDLSTVRKRA